MYQIINISGKSRHGKDTIADYLVSNYGFKKMSIADPLKEVCKSIFNFNDKQLYGDMKDTIDEFWGCTPRKCFQYIGTELFRDRLGDFLPGVEKNIWIKSLILKILNHFKQNPLTPIVIPDLRFKNELDFLKKYNFDICTFKVFNPNIESKDEHISESLDIKTDIFILNDSTIEQLYEKIDILFS